MTTYADRFKDLGQLMTYSNVAVDETIHTNNVMREETELLLQRQKVIYNILVVATIGSVLFTVNYARN